MSNYDITYDAGFIISNGEGLYQLYNRYGRGRITVKQFIALYLEDKLDDYIRKVKAERRETDDSN